MRQIRIFKYIEEIDCFVADPAYKRIADKLGVSEWTEVVWIGRYFMLDNDYGEHWFDNWEERDHLRIRAEAVGISYDDLLVISPDRFQDGKDGPCHATNERRRFWTDVLRSLELSLETIISEARKFNQKREQTDERFIPDLEERIKKIRDQYTQ